MKLYSILFILSSASGFCEDRAGCSDCMADPACAWCADPPPFNQPRCSSASSESVCGSIVYTSSEVEITKNNPLNLHSTQTQFVQIQPQAARANLRPGKPVNISFTVGHAENFPVDLYFLMDLSWSMRSSRDNLIAVTEEIIKAINNKTDDVNIGFGSFVEKNVAPFSSAVPEFNCASDNPNCAPPYSFYHQQNLDNITAQQFSKAVIEAPLAGNVDDPEGSLDALMQVMVCNERIGWRDTSRKIIILFTDKDFHFAMDGKLAGILKPNDGRCHLNETGNGSGYYTMAETQDYPSISHINSVAQANSFILLFAVVQDYKHIYQALVDRIPGSSVDVLSKDGSNIVQIVEAKYEEISTSLRMSAGTSSSGTKIRFFSSCGGRVLAETKVCSNIQIGTPVNFVAELTSDGCRPGVEDIPIFSVGMNESLVISVSSDCACPCSGGLTEVSEVCGGEGFLDCGECVCNPGHYGKACECSGESQNVSEDLCRAEGSTAVCSGRGECNCGVCTCGRSPLGLISGPFCECDDWTCPKDKVGNLCSGHGNCLCGKCWCEDGWTGDSCSCSTETDACLSPYDGEVCSGNGDCDCGSCLCRTVESGSALYTGMFCERNPLEGVGACSEVRECVECQQFGPPPDSFNCSACVIQSDAKERTDVDLTGGDVKVCTFLNRNSCTYSFSLQLTNRESVEVHLLLEEGRKEVCLDLGLQLGVGAGVLVLLVGIITICVYKICIEVTDRRQYARFQREVDRTKTAVNQMPNQIYKSPITKFENPTFGKS